MSVPKTKLWETYKCLNGIKASEETESQSIDRSYSSVDVFSMTTYHLDYPLVYPNVEPGRRLTAHSLNRSSSVW